MIRTTRGRIGSAIYLILAVLAALAVGMPLVVRAQQAMEELVLEVRVNEQDQQLMLIVLRDAEGQFWLDAEDLGRLRLRMPAARGIDYQGRRYIPLSSYAGVQLQFDATLAMLFLQMPAGAFEPVRISRPVREPGMPAPAANGLFVNYQLSDQRIAGRNSIGALTELGLFNRWGSLNNTMVARRSDGANHSARLDTVLSRDFPERLQTLSVGDAIADPGNWGTALRFGGIRFAKNFSIRPDLVTTPLLRATGSAVVPSAVDVFVNGQQVMSQQVQPGPFIIDSLPTVSGSGDVRVVVRDALGREQVLTQPFYSSPVLLAGGLNQYSFALGKVRDNYAVASFDYGKWVGSGTWRRGLNDRLTLEGHGEFVRGDAWGAGVDLAVNAGPAGVVTATAAYGGSSQQRGWLTGFGVERRGEWFTFALHSSYAAEGFRRPGTDVPGVSQQKMRSLAQASVNLGRAGSLTLATARTSYHDAVRVQTLSLDHGVRLGQYGTLHLAVIREQARRASTSGFLTFTRAIGSRSSFESVAERNGGRAGQRDDLRAAFTHSTPQSEGLGWRLGATRSGNYDAWLQQRTAVADIEYQAARNFGVNGQSLQVRGAATWLDGKLQAARAVDGSFAIVDVAGLADVPVYVENQLVTRTDRNGRALLHNLLSYEANRISIEPLDLPLNTSIAQRTLTLRPGYRSGIVARFPVERISPGVFRLLQVDGTPVPAGAAVEFNGGRYTVAMDGFTYVTTLDHGLAGSASWNGGACAFRVEPPPSDDPLPDMGEVLCRTGTGVAP